MRITRIGKQDISFKSTLKLNVPKSVVTVDDKGRLVPAPLSIAQQATSGDSKMFIGEDILILDADEKTEMNLQANGIPFEKIDGSKLNIQV